MKKDDVHHDALAAERSRENLSSTTALLGMNDPQSTIVGLKAQACPGGGWNGMPAELEGRATVADCLAHGACGCIYGDAVQHIERLQGALKPFAAGAANIPNSWPPHRALLIDEKHPDNPKPYCLLLARVCDFRLAAEALSPASTTGRG